MREVRDKIKPHTHTHMLTGRLDGLPATLVGAGEAFVNQFVVSYQLVCLCVCSLSLTEYK